MTANEFISTPNNPCREKPKTVILASHLADKRPVTYNLDRSLCEAYEWALEYHAYCGCVPLRYPIPAHIDLNTSRCLNVTHWPVNRTIDNIKCMSRVRFELDMQKKIDLRCKGIYPCKRLTYVLDSSSAVWPTASLAGKFADVLNETYNERIRNNESAPAWLNVINANESYQTNLIRENIAKVDFRPKSKRSAKMKESAAYPATNLFSDIGGILGLYLGMGLLSVIELLESIFIVVNLSRKAAVSRKVCIQKPTMKSSSDEPTLTKF